MEKKSKTSPQSNEAYESAIEAIRTSKVPYTVAMMHLRHGFSEGRICAQCSALGEMHVGEPYLYCMSSQTVAHFDPATRACGKFREREAQKT